MSEVGHLLERLRENAEKDIYPYHMPGHKRRSWGKLPEAIYGIDITEIDGFDNLHQPEGILRNAQQEAAHLYGAEESFYLVNGSSCGILSAVSCALPFGGHILMSRNCHKSAYHAAYLRKLAVSYVYPPFLEEYDIFDAVETGQIQEALEREGDINAVLIVSPTYEGRIADIAGIARVVHQKGIPLVVDEAHGAHLGLGGGFPPNSCQLGADLVIHSVHKTLPALTQAALLHVNGDRINRECLRRYLRIYQSSSPSYLLMASIDNALEYVKEDKNVFASFRERYESMVRNLIDRCRYLHFLPVEDGKQDVGKLLVSVKGCGLTGRQLYDILLQKYHLQLEMAAVSFVLAMFTVNDDEEGFRRMTRALLEIDGSLEERFAGTVAGGSVKGCSETVVASAERGFSKTVAGGSEKWFCEEISGSREGDSIPLAEAWDMDTQLVPLMESVGRRAGEFINLYPPGVPLLVPGERMTQKLCGNLLETLAEGHQVQGLYRERRSKAEETFFIPVISECKGELYEVIEKRGYT